jgi:hypothetical protein
MSELPPGHIEIRRSDHIHRLWLTPAIHRVLRIYARQNNISAIDAGNRILLGFLSEYYDYKSPAEVRRGAFKAVFPTGEVLKDTIMAVLKGKRPRRRPIPLHEDDKLPLFLTKPGSTDHDNP